MVKASTKSFNSLRKIIGFCSLFLISSCGLPSEGDYCSPPSIVEKLPGARIALRFDAPSNGFVLYYKVIRDGDTVDEVFSYDSEFGESIFEQRGYTKNEKQDSTNITFIWQPKETTVFPYYVNIEYPSLNEDYVIVKITDSANVEETFNVARYDEKKYSEIKKGDEDVASDVYGVCSVALATMNFKMDSVTLKISPSIGVFLDYFRGLPVN